MKIRANLVIIHDKIYHVSLTAISDYRSTRDFQSTPDFRSTPDFQSTPYFRSTHDFRSTPNFRSTPDFRSSGFYVVVFLLNKPSPLRMWFFIKELITHRKFLQPGGLRCKSILLKTLIL